MSDELYRSRDFEQFWAVYRRVHANRRTRLAHFVATSSALGLVGAGLVCRRPLLLALAPIVDYGIAQASHRLEGGRTRPHRRPLWHARAELRLWRETARELLF